jgi:hypothetical protein
MALNGVRFADRAVPWTATVAAIEVGYVADLGILAVAIVQIVLAGLIVAMFRHATGV